MLPDSTETVDELAGATERSLQEYTFHDMGLDVKLPLKILRLQGRHGRVSRIVDHPERAAGCTVQLFRPSERFVTSKTLGLTVLETAIKLMPMNVTRCLQIPVSEQEASRFHAAARRSRLSLAEWARRQLREKADAALGGGAFGPREALDLLKGLDAPVGPVEQMIEESIDCGDASPL